MIISPKNQKVNGIGLYPTIIYEEPTSPTSKKSLSSQKLKSTFQEFKLAEKDLQNEDYSPQVSFYNTLSPWYLNNVKTDRNHLEVFNRLIQDTNRRTIRNKKIIEFNMLCESKSAKVFTEKEEVYERLQHDVQIRRKRHSLKEQFKQKIEENEIKSYRNSKKISRNETDRVIERLTSKNYIGNSKGSYSKAASPPKNSDFTTIGDFNLIKSSVSSVVSPSVKKSTANKETTVTDEKNGKGRSKSNTTPKTGFLERVEIEKWYGQPGKLKSINILPSSKIKKQTKGVDNHQSNGSTLSLLSYKEDKKK